MAKLKELLNHRAVVFLYLFIIGFVFFKTYDRVFDKKVHLGGDNAGYYIYGKSIAKGEGYRAIHTKDKVKANHFPPGYPALIAVVMKTFSGKIETIKSANGFFLLAALFALFFLFRALTKNIHLSFIACMFTVLNFHMLEYSTIMMSEIPFVLFSVLSLLLFVLTDFEKAFYKNWKFFLFIGLLTFAFYIRTLGISLVISFTLILLFQKRWSYAAALVVGFILLASPWQIRSRSLGGNSYVNQLLMKNPYRPEMGPMELKDWPNRVAMNAKRYFALEITNGVLPFESIDYKQCVKQLKVESGVETVAVTAADSAAVKKAAEAEPLTLEEKQKNAAQRGLPDAKVEIETKDYLITIILLILMAIGLARMREHWILIGLYLAGTFSILFLWPEAWFGIRFMLPLVPILIVLVLHGLVQIPSIITERMKKPEPWLVGVVVPFVLLFGLYGSFDERITILEKRAEGIYINKFKNYFDIAAWSNKNLPRDAVVSCRKGQLFYLYANRWVTGFKNTLDKEELIEKLKENEVTHVVLDQLGYSSTSRYLYPAIKKYPGKFKVIYQLKNPDTYIMEFLPEMGYTGEWNGDNKHGQGTYKWPNGMSYVGEWKDNKRNGRGTFSWPNQQVFEGEWKDDKRHGPGRLTMPDGSYMEASWTNDILEGTVKLYTKEGQLKETSQFKNNQKVG
ncbi:MAG: hypothetical protein H6603_06290 [Flavobacteriales bacterium]|nr:hypothetical protein [Flavobacteriales bacterium]MCB9190331.1 hypothetical protein [Flavobacteriales bacterium]MCB9204571.1 hypothetical protein [Flavobacteriales bacterium]